MKVYIVQVIPEASLGKVSQEGYSTFEKAQAFVESRSDRPQQISPYLYRAADFTARQTSPTTSFTRSISSEKDSPARAFLSGRLLYHTTLLKEANQWQKESERPTTNLL